MNYNFQPDESPIDTWAIFYLPPAGNRSSGKLTVTNKRLLYNSAVDKISMEINKTK